eukprot:GFYU01026785.1.p1 GENE.GFYU01026785.1~~GFYU01026785.1.p1  ORF type:complete len:285 (+),score=66.92 GFYU01026785.1:250-1104(+)
MFKVVKKAFGKSKKKAFEDVYDLGDKLGSGTYAKVREAIHKKTNERFAVKIIDKSSSRWAKVEDSVLQEKVSRVQLCSHPNVMSIQSYHSDSKKRYIVMELMHTTLEEMVDGIPQAEADAINVIKQVCQGIQHVHERGDAHRYLTAGNVLLKSKDFSEVKVSDFGLDHLFQLDVTDNSAFLNYQFTSPEALKNGTRDDDAKASQPSDIWAIGCNTYYVLSGEVAFEEDNTARLIDRIREADFGFDGPVWKKVSDDAKDFIEKCLVVEPGKRMTIQQALKHPWLK